MGLSHSTQKINFEDVLIAYKKPENYLLINTLTDYEQDCLIINTIPASKEEQVINQYIHTNKQIYIIIYGRNSSDDKILEKYKQFIKLGFVHVFVYMGGLFEWLMLQDIYGYSEFPTTKKELDFLKFKPPSRLHMSFIEN